MKLAVGIPAYHGHISVYQSQMWIDFGRRLETRKRTGAELKSFLIVDTCGVDRARNYLLGHAMASGAEWLLMIDSDCWVADSSLIKTAGESLLTMIESGIYHGATIVGAPVARRGATDLNVYSLENEKYETISQFGSSLEEVDAIGAAVMAIDLNRIGNSEFRFTPELSEDLEFCRQVKSQEIGSKIFVDPRVKTCHIDNPTIMTYTPKYVSKTTG